MYADATQGKVELVEDGEHAGMYAVVIYATCYLTAYEAATFQSLRLGFLATGRDIPPDDVIGAPPAAALVGDEAALTDIGYAEAVPAEAEVEVAPAAEAAAHAAHAITQLITREVTEAMSAQTRATRAINKMFRLMMTALVVAILLATCAILWGYLHGA